MKSVEMFLGGALALIALYLIVKSPDVPKVIAALTGGAANIFATLQGRGGNIGLSAGGGVL